jgi:alpha-tubulin suppressor-like RCC1 family protein
MKSAHRPSLTPSHDTCWRKLTLLLLISLCAIRLGYAGGTLVGWGANDSRQSEVPEGLTNVIAAAGGESHSLALRHDGTVAAWGFNYSGQAEVPPGLNNVVAVAAGADYSMALTRKGEGRIWGGLTTPAGGLTNLSAIAAGWSNWIVLRRDRTVATYGMSVPAPEGLTNVLAVSAGRGFSLVLKADGMVTAWGLNGYGQTNVPANLTNVVAVAAGGEHALALTSSGRVVAWGRNDEGQTNVPSSLSGVISIGAGALHSLALKSDGTVVAWGDNTYGQTGGKPAEGGLIAAVAGGYHNLAIRGDGAPAILLQPVGQAVEVSKRAGFMVGGLGAAPLRYQWRRDGTSLAGATSSTLVINSVRMADSGNYTVVITNAYGAVTSAPAFLQPIGVPPIVSVPPIDTNAVCGGSAAFHVQVQGSSPFGYQWYFEGLRLAGATRSSLVLSNVSPSQAGFYSVTATNAFGSVTTGAALAVSIEPPAITSPVSAVGVQGVPFFYTVTAKNSPIYFGATYLPEGLAIDPYSGQISGIPAEIGIFGVQLSADNGCETATEVLILTVESSGPQITSPATVSGREGVDLAYLITASNTPLGFGASGLPPGLYLNSTNGWITGSPIFAGEFDAAIWASNQWGRATANLHLSVSNAPVAGLSVANVSYIYSSPYLLDFTFSLRDDIDPNVGEPILADPRLLSAICLENDITNSVSETGTQLSLGSAKLTKAYLVLDFTESIAGLQNGDTNNDGISDAIDNMVNGAITFVNQQSADTQIGVIEFHREDMDPSNVVALTTDKVRVNNAIAGIWTNQVKNFPAASRCWDAVAAAIKGLGNASRDEQHIIVLVSDGRDESSAITTTNIVNSCTNQAIRLYTLGFGAELDSALLQSMALETHGYHYTATSPGDLANQFSRISKEVRAQYILRWATLKKSATPMMPSFKIGYQGFLADSPTNPFTLGETNVDTTTDPPTTNIVEAVTNFIIAPYTPSSNAGPVLVGSLRLAANAEIQPTGIDLRASYIPRYIRQMRFYYRPNWPCKPVLQSTNPGGLLAGWTMTQTNDSRGGTLLTLSSTNTADLRTSLPFAGFGRLVTFVFDDVINASSAFSFFDVDTNLYTQTGGQSFKIENATSFVKFQPVLPYGTPVPWLNSYGYSANYTNAETLDPDGDGMANWQEYRANTVPTNAASAFVVRQLRRLNNGRFEVTFSTSTNRFYRVESSLDLQSWQTVQENIPGLRKDVTIIDTRYIPGLTNIFFRAVVLPP